MTLLGLKKLHPVSAGWALVALRLVVGFGFAFHGYAKLARGPENFAHILQTLGMPAPLPLAWITTWLELLGGIAVMLGAFVLPLAVPLGITMLTAMLTVHLRYGFSSIALKGIGPSGAQFGPVGFEINLLYLAGLAALALSDVTPLSLDRWRRRRARSA